MRYLKEFYRINFIHSKLVNKFSRSLLEYKLMCQICSVLYMFDLPVATACRFLVMWMDKSDVWVRSVRGLEL